MSIDHDQRTQPQPQEQGQAQQTAVPEVEAPVSPDVLVAAPSTSGAQLQQAVESETKGRTSVLDRPVRRRGALGIGAAILAFGALAGGGAFELNKNHRSNGTETDPIESPAKSTTPDTTKTPEAVSSIQKVELGDTELWKGLSEAKQKEFMRLATMPREEFMKLPDAKRAQVSEFVFRMAEPYVTAMLKQFAPNYEPMVKADVHNTADEVVHGVDTMRTAAYLMCTEGGDPATFGPGITNGESWVLIAQQYVRGLYASPTPDLDTAVAYLDGTTAQLDLPKMCDAGCYYGWEATDGGQIPASGPDSRVIEFGETWSDKIIRGTFSLVEFTPFDSKPGDTKKAGMWQMGAMVG